MNATHTKQADGSVSEYLIIDGNRITLKYAPDSEREKSAEIMEALKEMLAQEFAGNDKLVNPPRN